MILNQNVAQSISLKLEVERVNLLYRQNVQGIIALVLFSSSYVYVCGNLMAPVAFSIWLSLVVVSAVLRISSTISWNRNRARIKTLKEVNRWHNFLQMMLIISAMIWAYAGWLGAQSIDPIQQIATAIIIVFMTAGALVCWAPSMRAMFTFVIPAISPWAISYLVQEPPIYKLIGLIGITYVLLGARAGLALHRYIDESLKVNIQNLHLTTELQQEILVKDRAEEALRLALSSSDAIEWRWNVEKDMFTCQGDLSQSFGMKASFYSGSLDQLAQLFYAEDQQKFRAIMLQVALKGGDFHTDIRISWPDGQMHDLAFRGKAQSDSTGKITHLTGIAWDITAQKSQAKLKHEKDTHEAANRAKSVFLANASHEIRTPLAAINGFVEGLLQEPQQSAELKSDLQAISRNGKYLSSLVNDFLDLSKIESGRFYMQKGPMSPMQEIEESLMLVKPTLDAKGLIYQLVYDSAIPVSIESDPSRFRQIVVNLLSNAAKFTEQGKITLHIGHKIDSNNQGTLVVRVTDTGIGIDDKTRSQLFEPFMRGQTVEVQKAYGAGLGLALSKNLANILGGDLKLNFTEVDFGSEFEFTLNTGPADLLKFPVVGKKALAKRTLEKVRVLVVDDAVDLRVLMRRYLEKQGAVVETSENGLEAIDKALTDPIDVVLMDIKMPVMDGQEATKKLRQRGFIKPVIAITAHASADDKQKSLEAGCDYYLSKPVDFNFLTETILKTQKDIAALDS